MSATARPLPRTRIAVECRRRGVAAVAADCARLVGGEVLDESILAALVGHDEAAWVLDTGPGNAYWLRVWGARGLLWTWHDSALPALRAAVGDPAWRVRELVAKVVARHRLDDLAEEMAVLSTDTVPRVAAAAHRALARLTTA